MNMNPIPQKYLVADVIIIGLYGRIGSFFRHFVCKAPTNYLTANIIALILLSLSMAICVIGARAPEYRMRWVIFGVASVLGFVLVGGVNAVGAMIIMVQVIIW
ncbi:MAG: hypothetical protein H6Q99_1563 [Proteobacteria bacterium]|nr:hypothetical protein [Pseudomonadota bacterium]